MNKKKPEIILKGKVDEVMQYIEEGFIQNLGCMDAN